MLILFLKSTDSTSPDETEEDPLAEKLRRILESRVKEAKTAEDREWAERELRKFNAG